MCTSGNQHIDFKCVLDLVSGPCLGAVLFSWKFYKNKSHTNTYQYVTCSYNLAFDQQRIYQLKNSPPLTPHKGMSLFWLCKAMHWAKFHPLSCQPAADWEQHWNCQAISPGTWLCTFKGGLCSVCSQWASKTASKEFSHLLTKSDHTVTLKTRGISKQ